MSFYIKMLKIELQAKTIKKSPELPGAVCTKEVLAVKGRPSRRWVGMGREKGGEIKVQGQTRGGAGRQKQQSVDSIKSASLMD